MNFRDVVLLAKKILVGVAIGFVPLVILSGGLWFTQKNLAKNSWKTADHKAEVSRAN